MTNDRFRFSLRLMIVLLMNCALGCGPSADESAPLTPVNAVLCPTEKGSINPEQVKIEGEAVASPGETIHYRLNADFTCAKEQSYAWKAAGKTASAEGELISRYTKPGSYVVAASIYKVGSIVPHEVSMKTVVTRGLAIAGPSLGMADLEHHFELNVPADATVTGVQWNFGDRNVNENGSTQIDHVYFQPGDYVVRATVSLNNGDESVVSHTIKVLPYTDGMECVRDLAITGPTEARVSQPVDLSVFIPQCLSWRVTSVRWSFGDGTTASSQSVQHSYATAGTYSVIMEIFSGEGSGAFLTLTHPIVVSGEGPDPEDPEPEDPEPVDPLQCTVEGQQRQIEGEIKSEEKECGIDGKRTASYREVVTEECRLIGEFLRWTEVSRTRRELDPGQCQDQACEVPSEALLGRDGSSLGFILVNGVFYLPSGESRTFYSTTAPAGACAQVSQARSCKNGVLSGSTSHVHLSCNSGCEGVGVHGSTVKGVVTGQEQVAHRCAYNETGIFDTFQVVADKSCNNGQVVTANARRGSLITAGVCPTYNWVATESYTACDQNCGGQQTQIFECRDNKGAPAPQARCQDQGSAPVVKRVCDGNPEAVRRTESNTTIEEAGASAKCPRNQIGVVVQRREVTRIQAFACINHQVAKESDKTSYGPWVQENQCRDLVPHRCSGDSLSPQGASARLRWMLKCRQDVPAIDEFLKIMDGYMGTWNRSPELIVNGRIVYPTFLDSTSSPPRRWTAPVNDRVGCDVPSTVYVAAVCVASCATPEQQILAHNGERGKIEYVPIYDAWHDRFKHVATLTRQSTLESRHVQRTAVENWVAELQDETHEIMEFTMASGGKLSLTTNHPVLTPEGTMKLASDFQVGESLVRLGGQLDPIVQLERTSYVGKVYNVFVKSAELRENVVVTNGYLNGTAYFQNEGAKDLNRQLFRRQLIRGAFDK